MPRRAKPTQSIKTAPNQPYGQGAEQAAAMRAMPLPNSSLPSPAPPPPSGGGAALGAPPASSSGPGLAGGVGMVPGSDPNAAVDPDQLAMQHAAGYTPAVTPLTAPSQRPTEPVTNGLPVGPGAGPEALGAPPVTAQVSDMLGRLLGATNNQYLSGLAALAKANGV